jgi:DNA-directed RNA polymerase subunit RPC12/RpoP
MEKHQQQEMQNQSSGGGLFCSTCGAQVKDESALFSHMSRSHGVKEVNGGGGVSVWSGSSAANNSGYRYQQPFARKEHPPPQQTDYTGALVPNTNNSTKKTGEPVQSCHGCSMTFSSGLDLRKHIDLAHKGRQAGGGVGAAAATATSMEVTAGCSAPAALSSAAATSSSSSMPYQCMECAKEFADIPSLKAHRAEHLKERPFK